MIQYFQFLAAWPEIYSLFKFQPLLSRGILAYEVKFDDHLSSLDIEMVQTPMRIRDCWIVEKGQQGLDGADIAQSALDDLEVGFAM